MGWFFDTPGSGTWEWKCHPRHKPCSIGGRIATLARMYEYAEAAVDENGRITEAVTNMRFTQSCVDALGEGRILGLGDDARFADSEFASGIVYVSTTRLGSWNFTGGAEG